jgi:hypothetical protein
VGWPLEEVLPREQQHQQSHRKVFHYLKMSHNINTANYYIQDLWSIALCTPSQSWDVIFYHRFFLHLKYQFLKVTANRRLDDFLILLASQANGYFRYLDVFPPTNTPL